MAIFKLGFRPFYALASIFAAISLIVWLRAYGGSLGTGMYLHGWAWHSHELLFGFSAAVIAGFLLTAVRNWTGMPTLTGMPLAALAALWLMARVLIIKGPLLIAAVVDVLFFPALLLAIAGPILRSRNERNYKMLAILFALALSNGVFHLASLGYVDAWLSRSSMFTSIDIVLILFSVVSGRVIPAFTKNAVPEARSRIEPWVEIITFASMALVVLASALSGIWVPPPLLAALLFAIVAAAHATRLALWDPVSTVRNPLLWMMPAAYSWIPFAFLLRALATLNIVPASAWIHALMIGAVSGLMLAMMMRSSLGHTGRKLVAGRSDMTAFVLLQIAAFVRVIASLAAGETYYYWIVTSGLIWALAFLIFAVRYVPILSRPRASV